MAARDYFELFDLPRTLRIDLDALQKTFYELSKRYHPDRYENALPHVRRAVLRQSMLLNEAYSTLRDRRRRLLYLLKLEMPERNPEEQNMRVPPALFEIVEQAHDLLFELDGTEGEARRAVEEKLRALREEARAAQEAMWKAIDATAARWDENERAHDLVEIEEERYLERKRALLDELQAQNDDLSYIERLIENIDRALEGERDARPE